MGYGLGLWATAGIMGYGLEFSAGVGWGYGLQAGCCLVMEATAHWNNSMQGQA